MTRANIGGRPRSVFYGRDHELLEVMLSFYPRPVGCTLDVTANRRRMWKGLPSADVVFCDIDRAVEPDVQADFRHLPFSSECASLLVFDPPHLPAAAASPASMKHFVSDYGLGHSLHADNVSGFFKPFLQEATRVLMPDGLVFAKLADYVHNHRYQWMLAAFVSAVQGVRGLTACDLIIKCDPSAGNLTSGRWKSAFHARRSHCYWVVVRKGRCEPRQAK